MKEDKLILPDGWTEKNLGNICYIKKGVQFNKIELNSSGTYPCINGGIEESGYSEFWNTDKNTITISEGGNSCGFVNFVTDRFWSGGHCYTLLEINKVVVENFLYHFLKGNQNYIMDLRVGSGLPNIQHKALKEFPVQIPKSLEEQSKISSVLSKIDDAIIQTKILIDKHEKIKTGLIQDLTTKGIDEDGNIRSETTHKFKDSQLGKIPEEWQSTTLSYFILNLESGTSVNSDDIPIGSGQFGILKTSSLSNCEFNCNQNKTVKFSEIWKLKCPVRKGSILISRMNTPQKVGENALVKSDVENVFLPDRIWQTVFKNIEELDVEWLAIVLKSKKYMNIITNLGTGTSNSMKNISKKSFMDIIIPKIPVLEQQKIRENISKLENLEICNRLELTKLQKIKTGLMQDLLTGKVRVTDVKIEKTDAA